MHAATIKIQAVSFVFNSRLVLKLLKHEWFLKLLDVFFFYIKSEAVYV